MRDPKRPRRVGQTIKQVGAPQRPVHGHELRGRLSPPPRNTPVGHNRAPLAPSRSGSSGSVPPPDRTQPLDRLRRGYFKRFSVGSSTVLLPAGISRDSPNLTIWRTEYSPAFGSVNSVQVRSRGSMSKKTGTPPRAYPGAF